MAKRNQSTEQPQPESDDYLRIFRSKLLAARKKAGLTQTELGGRAGVKQSYIFELEQGKTNITVKTLVRMARILDVDPRELLPGKPMTPSMEAGIGNLASLLDRLATAIAQRTAQEEIRRREEAQFLKELRDLGSVLQALASKGEKLNS